MSRASKRKQRLRPVATGTQKEVDTPSASAVIGEAIVDTAMRAAYLGAEADTLVRAPGGTGLRKSLDYVRLRVAASLNEVVRLRERIEDDRRQVMRSLQAADTTAAQRAQLQEAYRDLGRHQTRAVGIEKRLHEAAAAVADRLGRDDPSRPESADTRPRTLREAVERWPDSIWVTAALPKGVIAVTGSEFEACYAAMLSVAARNLESRESASWPREQAALVLDSQIEWRGANVWIAPPQDYYRMDAVGVRSEGDGWFARLFSLGPAAEGETSLRAFLTEHGNLACYDFNIGNTPPHYSRLLSRVYPASDLLAGPHPHMSEEVSRRWLDSGVTPVGANLTLHDRAHDDYYYLMSFDPLPSVEAGRWETYLSIYGDRPDWTIIPVIDQGRWGVVLTPHVGKNFYSDALVSWYYASTRFTTATDAVTSARRLVEEDVPGAAIDVWTDVVRVEEDRYPRIDPKGTDLYRRERERLARPPKLPKGWRSDAPVVKHIAEDFGLKAAHRWQRAPLVYLTPEDRERVIAAKEDLRQTAAAIEHLPWREFIIDLGVVIPGRLFYVHDRQVHVHQNEEEVRMWVRVTERAKWHRERASLSPWLLYDGEQPDYPGEEGVMIETFIQRLGRPKLGLPVTAEYYLHDWEHEWSCGVPVAEQGVNPEEVERVVRHLTIPAMWVLAYLSTLNRRPEYLVQQWEPGAREVRDSKPSPKPWTVSHLPTIRLLEPGTIKVRRAEPLGGTHASPTGHPRAGHPRTLKHPMFYRDPPHCETFVPSGACQPAPPPMAEVFYGPEQGHARFVSGTYTNPGPTHVWTLTSRGWRELVPRTYFVKDTWVGPEQGEDDQGRPYRVLLRESGAELPDPDKLG